MDTTNAQTSVYVVFESINCVRIPGKVQQSTGALPSLTAQPSTCLTTEEAVPYYKSSFADASTSKSTFISPSAYPYTKQTNPTTIHLFEASQDENHDIRNHKPCLQPAAKPASTPQTKP